LGQNRFSACETTVILVELTHKESAVKTHLNEVALILPEVYGHFPSSPATGEYFSGIDRVVAGNIVNVHNWMDDALTVFMVGQWQKPDLGWGYSDMPGDQINKPVWSRQDGIPGTNNGKTQLSFGPDTAEIFAHIAEAKSPALGASVEGGNSTQNVIKRSVDTMKAFSEHQRFGGNQEDHSAQFRSINMRRWEFWNLLLRHEEMFEIQTDYPNTP
jgi:hypothetical protein